MMQGKCNADPGQRSVTVMITDACPQCEDGHFDVQALTFLKVRGSSSRQQLQQQQRPR